MLIVALGLGFLIASPQLLAAWRYYPRSIRSSSSASDKQAIGNIPVLEQLKRAMGIGLDQPCDGVFGPEANTFVGLPAVILTFLSPPSPWHIILITSLLLASGKHTPLFRLTSKLHLRIPARYCYFTALSLAFLAIDSLASFPVALQLIVTLLQAWSLVLLVPQSFPMEPYVQRWNYPSRAFCTPLTQFFGSQPGAYRVSGLPYPLRTGQINRIHTLGYNGGSQAKWMAKFRNDTNPHGSGAHDWFMTQEDGKKLDEYGVRFAYTYRPLSDKWKPTMIPHLYENSDVMQYKEWNY